jgi:murein DD-endopeptidase MepM/ murein hydrolase activator NlpD
LFLFQVLMKLLCALCVLALLSLPIRFPERMDDVPLVPGDKSAGREAGKTITGTFPRNTSLGAALQKAISPRAIHDLVEATRPVYDLARISAGHPFGLSLDPEGALRLFTYGIDELRTLRVRRSGDDLLAEIVTKTYEIEQAVVAGVIRHSLFGAVEEAGEQDQLALDLAEIFAWDVDFNTEIQKGDSFRVAVEKLTLEGRFSRYGRILAAEFARGERVLRAVRFDGEVGRGYYTPEGTPLRKAFLRSPLRFTRISSGFSLSRLHPILNYRRPHLGIDYAAPTGTPVNAAADGVVVAAGWQGGFGKLVRMRHANGYETLYGHLSRIAVRVGQRVAQGTPIGAVGMTGLASGPHLDYRMIKSGVFVNPLRIQSPPAEPISAAEREAFEKVRSASLALLDGTADARRLASAEAAAAAEPATQ